MKRFDEVNSPVSLYHNHDLLFALNQENKIFNITERESPSFLATFSLPSDGYMKTLLTIFKKWAFFNAGYQGLFLLDIIDPFSPKCIKLSSDISFKFQHFKDYYFVVALGRNGGRIYDLKHQPELRTASEIPGDLFDFFVHRNCLFGACLNQGFKVFDLISLEEPNLISHPFGNFLCMSLELFHDDVALIKNEQGQILILDISDAMQPRRMAVIEGRLLPYKNFFVHYPFLIVQMVESGHLFKVFDCSRPSDPRLIFTYPCPHVAYVVQQGPFIAAWGNQHYPKEKRERAGMHKVDIFIDIMRISNNGELKKVISFEEEKEVYSVTIADNFIYIAKGDGIFVTAIPKR